MLSRRALKRGCETGLRLLERDGVRWGSSKPRVVVLGSGWGGFAAAKGLDRSIFDVTVVSARNHMLFTPLLASTAVGTLEFRSIAEPVRDSLRGIRFEKGKVRGVDLQSREVAVRTEHESGEGVVRRMHKVPFDVLITAIGARSNTFNIPGAEPGRVHFLKELSDARSIRRQILQNVEAACSGGVPEEERRRLLRFVVVGGGPTGVEFAAELHDLVAQDLRRLFGLSMEDVRIQVVEAGEVLGMFEASLRSFAKQKFAREGIEIVKDAVVEVTGHSLKLRSGTELPFGMCVWSTGIAARKGMQSFDPTVFAKDEWGHVLVDPFLRVLSASKTLSLPDRGQEEFDSLRSQAEQLAQVGGGGEVSDMARDKAVANSPHACSALQQGFLPYTIPGVYAIGDCASVVGRRFAATAQVAEQQGTFLAEALNSAYRSAKHTTHSQTPSFSSSSSTSFSSTSSSSSSSSSTSSPSSSSSSSSSPSSSSSSSSSSPSSSSPSFSPSPTTPPLFPQPSAPFAYRHIASLAYLGDFGAVSDFSNAAHPASGLTLRGTASWLVWRSVYLTKLGSLRNRLQVPADWTRALLFGRDTAEF